jgi:hypothetical protein
MAIHTRFGREVEIISHAYYPDHDEVIIRDVKDPQSAKAVWLHDLVADDGIKEISAAIDRLYKDNQLPDDNA